MTLENLRWILDGAGLLAIFWAIKQISSNKPAATPQTTKDVQRGEDSEAAGASGAKKGTIHEGAGDAAANDAAAAKNRGEAAQKAIDQDTDAAGRIKADTNIPSDDEAVRKELHDRLNPTPTPEEPR